MSVPEPYLLVTTSPFLKERTDTASIMWQVVAAAVPILVAATWFFGVSALLISAAAVAGALLPEWLGARINKTERTPVRDGSAVLTGLLLALTLPPGTPLWMAFLGGVAAILLGKTIFGGIGANMFNPALVGRAFLQAAFPASMTTWSFQAGGAEFAALRGDLFAVPLTHPEVDAVSSATPLAMMKFDGQSTDWADLALGTVSGSLGETSALLILACGLFLVVRRLANWRIPIALLGSVWLTGTLLHALDPTYPDGLFHLASGGLMLGAWFMATDPVTSPITQAGCWLFGILIGVLVVIIRVFGGLPEGVMYAILFMNAMTPLINRLTQPRTFGTRYRPSFTR